MTDKAPILTYQLDLSMPREERFVATVRDIAIHAARLTGCSVADADEFGRTVETALAEYLRQGPSDTPIAIVVRREDGPLEVCLDEQTIHFYP